MHIVIATGIFPPAIGGTATYAKNLAEGLAKKGHEVRVVTYGSGKLTHLRSSGSYGGQEVESGKFPVTEVSNAGGIFSRWWRYAKVLKEVGKDADVVIALSSVSVGMPLMLAGLKKPKKILRLGGDFFWERYTDAGGMMSLREWYESSFGLWRLINMTFMEAILLSFDQLVYSTEFQKKIHESVYKNLPKRLVIGNAAPTYASKAPAGEPNPSPIPNPTPNTSRPHTPFKILFMGRFVGFKNLLTLIEAMAMLPHVKLTMVGDGPMEAALRLRIRQYSLEPRIEIQPAVHGDEKWKVFAEHDQLIIPSITDISPNVALEAASACLPVVMTGETGYMPTRALMMRAMKTPEQIISAIETARLHYEIIPRETVMRNWDDVANEWDSFLKTLV